MKIRSKYKGYLFIYKFLTQFTLNVLFIVILRNFQLKRTCVFPPV